MRMSSATRFRQTNLIAEFAAFLSPELPQSSYGVSRESGAVMVQMTPAGS
jgi:hypothetical protein